MADDFIERCTDAFGIGRISIAERCRDSACIFVEFADEDVQFFGGDAFLRMLASRVEDIGGEPAGFANAFDLLGGF